MKRWGQSFTIFHVQSISLCQKFVLRYYMQICSLHETAPVSKPYEKLQSVHSGYLLLNAGKQQNKPLLSLLSWNLCENFHRLWKIMIIKFQHTAEKLKPRNGKYRDTYYFHCSIFKIRTKPRYIYLVVVKYLKKWVQSRQKLLVDSNNWPLPQVIRYANVSNVDGGTLEVTNTFYILKIKQSLTRLGNL